MSMTTDAFGAGIYQTSLEHATLVYQLTGLVQSVLSGTSVVSATETYVSPAIAIIKARALDLLTRR